MFIACRNYNSAVRTLAARCSFTARNFSSDKKNDNEKDEKKNSKEKNPEEETAAERLNKLLASMQSENNSTIKEVNMAKPGGNRKRLKGEDSKKNVFEAAKNVAALLGEENKLQTESELLSKLLNHTEEESSLPKESTPENKTKPSDLSLSDLIVGMKIDRRQPAIEFSRSDYVRKTLSTRSTKKYDTIGGEENKNRSQHKRQAEQNTGSVNLFGSKPLEIFKDSRKLHESTDILKTWELLSQRELKLAVTHPPTNYFEKMALWTDQGKLWKFPIDNEQGLDEEAATDFSEHIFLEQYLEPWCPTKGPIRHFMELVCVGLAKNPYISAKEKKAHIMWYCEYFEQKKDLLKEVIITQKETPNTAKKIE